MPATTQFGRPAKGRRNFNSLVVLYLYLMAITASAQTAVIVAGNSNSISPSLTNGLGTIHAVSHRVLQPNDVLTVSIYQQADLNSRVTIDDNGTVNLPLLGRVEVGGRTLEQATELVRSLYDRDYLVNPVVTVQIEQMAALRFSVLGEIQHPGSYEIPANESISLLEGIARAGGFTRLAAASRVTVQRVEEGRPKIYAIDAEAMGNDTNANPFRLQPGDIVTVNQRVF